MSHKEQAYLSALAIVVICTLVAGAMFPHFAPENLIMVYLVGIVLVATRFGRGASILASILSVAAFDFFFVHPFLTFAVSDTQYLVTFGVMLLVALTISTMTVQIRQQTELARQREQHTASLYQLSHEFANSQSLEELIQVAVQQMSRVLDSQVSILLADHLTATTSEQGVAHWVYKNRQTAGLGTKILPGSKALYLPLLTASHVAGVLVIQPHQPTQFFLLAQVEAFANQIALAIERATLRAEAEASRMAIETEHLRNALLSSISHDLRTPLASITGAASSLSATSTDIPSQQELHQIIYEEAERLNRLVGNLLDMTRIEAGGIHVKKEWELLEEVIGSTLLRLKKQLSQHELHKNLPQTLLLVPMDSVLIEQVLVNLIENAAKYSSSLIELEVEAQPDQVLVSIMDRGLGIPAGSEERIFEKFQRAAPENIGGVGLGLTICRSIITAHGGRIWAENRPGGGSSFRFTLPIEGKPPEVALDE